MKIKLQFDPATEFAEVLDGQIHLTTDTQQIPHEVVEHIQAISPLLGLSASEADSLEIEIVSAIEKAMVRRALCQRICFPDPDELVHP